MQSRKETVSTPDLTSFFCGIWISFCPGPGPIISPFFAQKSQIGNHLKKVLLAFLKPDFQKEMCGRSPKGPICLGLTFLDHIGPFFGCTIP